VIVDEVGEPEADDWGDVAVGATARSQADAPEIDGQVFLRNVPVGLRPGDFASALIEDADAHDLFGVLVP
jgi:ribosomal protein S12 methylthiotransferase